MTPVDRKRPAGREIIVRLVLGLSVIFATGAMFGLFELVLRLLLQGQGFPRWSALKYAGVAFALGVGYLVAAAVFYPIGRILINPDKVTDPLWKRSLRLLALLMIFGAVIVGGAVLENRGWIPSWLRWS